MDLRVLRHGWHPAALVLTAAISSTAAADAVPDAAVVRFNAICATCHEGECSRRLSFDSGADAARNHMVRHAGNSDERLLHDLYAILRYTKETCRQYPLAKPLPARSDWTGPEIASWRDPESGVYFIPLGEIGAGERRLELEFDGPAEGDARLADEQMDTVAEERFSCSSVKAVALTATAGTRYYLHLHTKATLRRLHIR